MFDFLDGFDIEDWMIIGPLSQDLADERERRLEEDLDQVDEEPW